MTDTLDREGRIIEKDEENLQKVLDKENVETVLNKFLGKQKQTPPMQ